MALRLAAILILAGTSGCQIVSRALTSAKVKSVDIQIHEIIQKPEDKSVFTMWVLYDPVAPPPQARIQAKIKETCDRLCQDEGYYGYFIESSSDYELGKGLCLEVRFFGFKWEYDQYMRTRDGEPSP